MINGNLAIKQPLDATKKAGNYVFLPSAILIKGELTNYNKSIHYDKISCKINPKVKTITC